MNAQVRVTVDHLRVIADLIGLEADPDRLARLLPLVQALWDGVAALDELDLEGIEPEPVFRAGWEAADGAER